MIGSDLQVVGPFTRPKRKLRAPDCPGRAVKLLRYDHDLPCDHEVMDSSTRNNLLQKCRERLHTKIQSGWILSQTLHKRELRAPGYTLVV
jgi:hypothetical protein